jgi:hypothetical protein
VNVALAVVSAAALVACGGGGSGGTDGGSPSLQGGTQSTAISGMVSDGAIQGATVFLDLNANQAQDTGEPVSGATAADGSFKIDTSSLTAAQVKAGHLVSVVPTTAKDADDAGKTLAEAGKASFALMAPTAAYAVAADGSVSGAVVSPITTLVSHDMVSDGSKSLAAATATVQSRLGLPSSTSLTQDPSKSATLKTMAQVIAAALGEVQKLAKEAKATDRQALLAALFYVQQNGASLKKAVDGVIAAAPEGSKPKASDTVAGLVGASSTHSALKADTASLLDGAKQITGSTLASVSDMLAAGTYSIWCVNNCGTAGPRYEKLSGTASTWVSSVYNQVNGAWVSYPSYSHFVPSKSGWIERSRASGTFTPDAQGGVVGASDGWQARVSVRVQDVAGKKVGDIPGLNPPSDGAALVLPAGSLVYYSTLLDLFDSYVLYSDFAPGTYNGGAGFNSLFNMVDAAQTPAANQPVNLHIGSNGLIFTFNELSSKAGPAGGGTVTLYSCSMGLQAAMSGCTGGTWSPSGMAGYSLTKVNGQDVLRINAPYGSEGRQLIFGVVNGKVLGGDFVPCHVPRIGGIKFNKTAIDFLLAQSKLPAAVN